MLTKPSTVGQAIQRRTLFHKFHSMGWRRSQSNSLALTNCLLLARRSRKRQLIEQSSTAWSRAQRRLRNLWSTIHSPLGDTGKDVNTRHFYRLLTTLGSFRNFDTLPTVSSEYMNMFPPGFEPGTFRVWGERDNHYTTETCTHKKDNPRKMCHQKCTYDGCFKQSIIWYWYLLKR